jgi:hypothetical protein
MLLFGFCKDAHCLSEQRCLSSERKEPEEFEHLELI